MKKYFIILSTIYVLFVMAFHFGCRSSFFFDEEVSEDVPTNKIKRTTPNGNIIFIPKIDAVYLDNSIITENVYEFIDSAFDEAVIDAEKFYGEKFNKSIPTEIIDDYAFKCTSYSGLCAGWTNFNIIRVSLYSRWSGNNFPTFITNPRLTRSKEDMRDWTGVNGWLSEGSNYYTSTSRVLFPAWVHEFGHIIGKIADD